MQSPLFSFFPFCRVFHLFPVDVFPSLFNRINSILTSKILVLEKYLLKFIRPVVSKTESVNDHIGLKLLLRYLVGFITDENTNLNNFNDTLHALCTCSNETEMKA